ncbi:MAG: saccharopine dehydrogenase family protein [Phycisphaerae bacterium]
MSYRYVVLGSGRQGVALAFDLAKNCEAGEITLVDSDETAAITGATRIATLLPNVRCRVEPVRCDMTDHARLRDLLRGASVVLSAVPYRFNAELTDLAIDAGAHFNDLGGNTDVVRTQLARHDRARAAGISIVPDCGLAPGLGNILAAHGVAQLDQPIEAHVRCGGLPERPVGPLGYKLLFNFQGLINEYSGCGEFLRGGKRVDVPALTEIEEIEFAAPIGRCEAAITSGGTSTCAESFLGKLQAYDYKTVRYPGHWAVIRALFGLRCFDERVTLRGGKTIEPKSLLRELMEDQLQFPDVFDITVLRSTVSGMHDGRAKTIVYELIDRHDHATGFTAMERTTAFPTTLVAHMQARGLIAAGAQPLETCIPLNTYLEELERHDVRVRVTEALK